MERNREERNIRLEKQMNLISVPVIPLTPPGSGGPSSSIPPLESCPSSSDGGEDLEEEPQESDDSFCTAVLPVEQGLPSADVVEVGGSESSGQVWIQSSLWSPKRRRWQSEGLVLGSEGRQGIKGNDEGEECGWKMNQREV
ncbi:hypothetical protein BJ322DRAFT_1024280 [Thelephora terrestris]|uniref:Uncharacterized protein n=1 Tax=Thelephora terrestris TaxID=56493 RepID=A0A9P6H5J0_9AGAM|nr:hypothetical protein BJ322DRAFT_1024280 [Thelephora terrestris]